MALIQSQDPSAALDRVLKRLVVHCGLRTDNLTAAEMEARAKLAGRWLDAFGGDAEAVDFSNAPGTAPAKLAFADELLKLGLSKTLT